MYEDSIWHGFKMRKVFTWIYPSLLFALSIKNLIWIPIGCCRTWEDWVFLCSLCHFTDLFTYIAYIVSSGTYDQVAVEVGARAQGYRSMAVSSDGNYLAAGDHHGNLHLYNLHTSDYTCFQVTLDCSTLPCLTLMNPFVFYRRHSIHVCQSRVSKSWAHCGWSVA